MARSAKTERLKRLRRRLQREQRELEQIAKARGLVWRRKKDNHEREVTAADIIRGKLPT